MELEIDGTFKLEKLEALGKKGWKFCFTLASIGSKRNTMVLQRVKDEKDTIKLGKFEPKEEDEFEDVPDSGEDDSPLF